MNAAEIRKLYVDNISGRLDGSLDEDNLRNALLGEIAAQLAEQNAPRRLFADAVRDAIYSEASQIRKGFIDHFGNKIPPELRAFADARLEEIRKRLTE